MKKRIECVVGGKVQGVFFRDFAVSAAEKSGLSGFVKNNSGGTVAVVAEGEEENLKIFLAELEKGTDYSKIENISVKWSEASGEFGKFEVEY